MTGRASTVVRNLVLIAFALLFLGPIYLIFINALKGEADIEADPLGIPLGRLTLDNLTNEILNPTHGLIPSYVLSAWITVISVALAIFLGSVLGYLLARSRGRLPVLVYLLLLAGLATSPWPSSSTRASSGRSRSSWKRRRASMERIHSRRTDGSSCPC